MNAILELAPADKRRRLMNDAEPHHHSLRSSSSCIGMNSTTMNNNHTNNGFSSFQQMLERVSGTADRIPTADIAFNILTRWFRIIAEDTDKLRLFQSWVKSSEEDATRNLTLSPLSSSLNGLADSVCRLEVTSPTSSHRSQSFEQFLPASPETTHNNNNNSNNNNNTSPLSTHPQSLYKQLLQQQQQQATLLQQLQQHSQNNNMVNVNNIPTITMLQKSGTSGSLISLVLKGGKWHPHTQLCSCSCGFTASEGPTIMAQRVPGGAEGQFRFMVPRMKQSSSQCPIVIHMVLCSSPDVALVSMDQFLYIASPKRTHSPPTKATNSDEESDMSEAEASSSSPNDDDSNEGNDSLNRNNDSPQTISSPCVAPTPKQLMTIRERLIQFTSSPAFSAAPRIVVQQQPPIRVVWKNRRLDTPFKIRIEASADDLYNIASKYFAIAIVSDHKGRLQTDAADNYAEEFNPAGVATFSGLRMTKGTWGKEWNITFVAVTKTSISSPSAILAASAPCNIVVKTRKNPQIRHSGGINKEREESSSPVQFVERKPVTPGSLKRNRVEDLLDGTPQPPHLTALPPIHSPVLSLSAPTSRNSSIDGMIEKPSHCNDDFASLLYAAEIKQQEQAKLPLTQQQQQQLSLSSSSSTIPTSISSPLSISSNALVAQQPPPSALMPVNTNNNNNNNDTTNFATLQSLVSFLEEIKAKHQLSLKVIDQPQIKEGVVVVKKGKPFRIPFRVQMSSCLGADAQQQGYSLQQYVCVAVIRNDKGEEVAVKNNEVTFDWCGVACFPGLMVMKGTWGKHVSLSFETRWASSSARRLCGATNGSSAAGAAWPIRMLTMAETTPIPLMCYTKDKKTG